MRGDRAVSRGRGTTLDGQRSGPRWLSRMKPRERLGAAMGKGERERDRGRKSAAGRARSAAEIGAMSREGASKRDRRPFVTTSSRDANEASCTANSRSCSDRPRTKRDAQNGCKRHTLKTTRSRRRGTPAHQRPENHRRERLRVRIQRVWKGRGPTCANLPGAAFPDFQGDAGVKLLEDNLGLRAMDLSRGRKTVNVSR